MSGEGKRETEKYRESKERDKREIKMERESETWEDRQGKEEKQTFIKAQREHRKWDEIQRARLDKKQGRGKETQEDKRYAQRRIEAKGQGPLSPPSIQQTGKLRPGDGGD